MAITTLYESNDPLAALGKLAGPADIRAFLGFSLADAAQHITDPTSHNRNTISRATWWDWEHGRNTPKVDQVRQMEMMLLTALHAELAYDKMLDEYPRKFHIRIQVGARRWFVRAFVACVKCSRPYHITRLASKRCSRCITKSKQ